jgi:diaminopimelate decarboxylase
MSQGTTNKKLPFTAEQLREIVAKYGTPFHLYLEEPMRANAQRLNEAFAWTPAFQEYFAVKALPNPHVMRLLADEGFGMDCSSLSELILAEKIGLKGEDICFTANDTPAEEYKKALELGAVINLDDISHIPFLAEINGGGLPETISFRYNPGSERGGGNEIIGYPEEAKYGMMQAHIFQAFDDAAALGAKRFGLHTMLVSNELNCDYLVDTARMMFELAAQVKEKKGIHIEFINLGGGIGIPYHPEEEAVNLEKLAEGIKEAYEQILVPQGLGNIKLCMENGRMITGPYGYLVSTAIHKKDTYKHYIGLDSCMVDLMRPALYGAYHHITVLGKEDAPAGHTYDITGSLCENNDKFAINRNLPEIEIGDIIIIHDTGAHGHSMGFNYNGKLRSKEVLLRTDGSTILIRRAETLADYFATLTF